MAAQKRADCRMFFHPTAAIAHRRTLALCCCLLAFVPACGVHEFSHWGSPPTLKYMLHSDLARPREQRNVRTGGGRGKGGILSSADTLILERTPGNKNNWGDYCNLRPFFALYTFLFTSKATLCNTRLGYVLRCRGSTEKGAPICAI